MLPSSLHLGALRLSIRDLVTTREFYEKYVGLEVMVEDEASIMLGSGGREVLELAHEPTLPRPRPNDAGLYHLALLYNSPYGLTKALERILTDHPERYEGSSDHLVSQAFYFTDPDGNGIELYVDRPRESWQWAGGTIVMGSVPLDPTAFVYEHRDEAGSLGLRLGHVHLKVGNIAQAHEFYVGLLGFDLVANLASALFISKGGYHHHIGLNVWESAGSALRPHALGLARFELVIGRDAVNELRGELEKAGYPTQNIIDGFSVDDPWGNRLIFR
jgi:catechol 2,3-dioxygenase